MKYSATTNGFYLPEIHGNNIPFDAVEITEAEYLTLLAGQSQGKRIVAGVRGLPVLADQPPKPLSEVKAAKLRELEAARKNAIDTLPPVTVAGKTYPATPEYREVVTGIARRQAAGRPIPATLRGLDGTPATLNAALINQIDDAITSAVQAVWDRYWTRFDAVQAATTTAEAESIVW